MQFSPPSPSQPAPIARVVKPAHYRLRFAVDALIGLAVFFTLTAATLGPSAAASLLGIETPDASLVSGSKAVPLFVTNYANAWDSGGTNTKFLILAAVFSALFALNNAFVRHLRKAYIRSHKGGSKLARD